MNRIVYVMLLVSKYDDYPEKFKKFSKAIEKHLPKKCKLLYKGRSKK